MYIDSIYKQPTTLKIEHQVCVPTFLICQNGLVHKGLQHLLSGTGFAVLNNTFDTTSAFLYLPEGAASLVLVHDDPRCPDTAAMIRQVKSQYPWAKVVVLAERFEPEAVLAHYAAGADGFCLAGSSPEVLVTSLELIMLGQVALPPEVVLLLLDEMACRPHRPSSPPTMTEAAPSHPVLRKLSSREAEILRCLMRGEPNKVIARNLDVAEAPVKVHVKAILRKIGAGNRTQAALWATQHLSNRGAAST